MKNSRGTRPTRRQKIIIQSLRLNIDDWLFCAESDTTITLINKHTGTTITKYKKELSK